MCATERISYGFQDLESYIATISVFIILNKGVSVRDGQPKFFGGTKILLKKDLFFHVKSNNSVWETSDDKINEK